MKKLLVILATIAVSAMTMYGQGRVFFSNVGDNNAVTIRAGSAQGPVDGYLGADYSIQLLFAPGTITNLVDFTAAATKTTAIATFYGATGTGPTHGPAADGAGLYDFGVTVPIGPVGTYTFQAIAWYNGGTYATFDAAAAAGKNVGSSGLISVAITASPTPAPTLSFAPFSVNSGAIIPEPSTFALAGFGLASLVIFRRRK